MKSFIHSQTWTVAPLKFGNGRVVSFHIILSMWLLKLGLKVIHVSGRDHRGIVCQMQHIMTLWHGIVFHTTGLLWRKPRVTAGFPLQRANNSGPDLDMSASHCWLQNPWRLCYDNGEVMVHINIQCIPQNMRTVLSLCLYNKSLMDSCIWFSHVFQIASLP